MYQFINKRQDVSNRHKVAFAEGQSLVWICSAMSPPMMCRDGEKRSWGRQMKPDHCRRELGTLLRSCLTLRKIPCCAMIQFSNQ